MEKLKEYIWKRIVYELEKSKDEKIKNFIKAFKNKEELINYVKFYSNLNFDDMKRISGLSYYIRKRKFHMKGCRLLGNQTKAMPDEIYRKLIDEVEKEWGKKIKLALEFEGIEGPRGEDVVRLRLSDFNFDEHIVRIQNRKENRLYKLPINPKLEKELREFIIKNKREIELHKGFIFFSQNNVQKRDFISQKWLRNVVRNVLDKLGLNKVYSEDYKGRKLHLYSLHSLRGHAATRISKKTNNNIRKVQELLDHEPGSADTTLLYLERNNEKDLKGIV